MKQIRQGVFETNSSSSHSVSIRKGNLNPSELKVNSLDGKVSVNFGSFGWGPERLTEQHEKLSYLCTMLVATEGRRINSLDEFYETKGFKAINEAIQDYCYCDGIIFNDEITLANWGNENYIQIDGYIDHQSCEDYSNIEEFLNDYRTNIIDFIFNNGVVVNIDNDNH
jgi:hypothetical protein